MVGGDGGLDHDADEVDLTGLMESIVDSDEEEDLAESIDVSRAAKVHERCNYNRFASTCRA